MDSQNEYRIWMCIFFMQDSQFDALTAVKSCIISLIVMSCLFVCKTFIVCNIMRVISIHYIAYSDVKKCEF